LAKIAVKNNKYALAKQDLQWALKHSKIAGLKQIARIRIAAIDLQLSHADDALKVLKTVDDKTFMPMINTLMGDAYHKQGNLKKAQDYYQKAQSGYSSLGINNQIITMKLAG
jgi:predicted negative regulator of RcsB-dependent stress response